MKLPLAIFAFTAALISFIGWHRWDASHNRGFEHGYYGEFNRVRNALATIPDVNVTNSWHHLDVTLEEFGFDIAVAGRPVRLSFGEDDLVREMKRDAAREDLKVRITTELAYSQNGR